MSKPEAVSEISHLGSKDIYAALRDGILMTSPSSVELEPEPIPEEWILSGSPVTRCKKVVRSRDLLTHIVVWDCTPGSFKWYYSMDEAIMVVSGEAFMINDKGEERRFGPGDLAFFPAGSSCSWRITQPFRKVGFLKENVGKPLGYTVKIWRKLLRMLGFGGKSALMLALALWTIHGI